MTTKERLDRHDRQIAAIRALLQEGIRLMVETRKELRALAAAQRKTDAQLQEFIRSLQRGSNGHAKKPAGL